MEKLENKLSPRWLETRVTEVSSAVFSLVTPGFLLERRKILESSGVPVYLVKGRSGTKFRVNRVNFDTIAQATKAQEYAIPSQWSGSLTQIFVDKKDNSFLTRWRSLLDKSPSERVQDLQESGRKLQESLQTAADPEERAQRATDASELAFMVNKANLGLGNSTDELLMVKETHAIVGSVFEMLTETKQARALFGTLQSLSNGQTLGHVVRVLGLTAGFLVFYNRLHTAGLSRRVRSIFPKRYRKFYEDLIPGLPTSLNTSDNLVRLPAVSEAKARVWALGALMHDIGKGIDLEYFEDGSSYDEVKIKQHPILGSGLFKKSYGPRYEDARYIIGDHHNYLSHPEGYGLSQWVRSSGTHRTTDVLCSVADDLDAYTLGRSLAYFPVEVCALVDIYDALTDPSRKYKKSLSSHEAIEFMRNEFRDGRKVDPVLFDLFATFLEQMDEGKPFAIKFLLP